MWRRFLLPGLIGMSALALVACGDGNPFDGSDVPPDESEDPGDGDGNNNGGAPMIDGVRPGHTGGGTSQVVDGSIQRAEARSGSGGWVDAVRANEDGTFTVVGPAFDGAGPYVPGVAVSGFTGTRQTYYVYDAEVNVPDMGTGQTVPQIVPYRALYGVSNNNVSATDDRPRTSFAIVRTGGYLDYGYGGFVYARNGSVTLPTEPLPGSGQAIFTGDYAGIRIFDGTDGLQYTTGDAAVRVDFQDFPTNPGVGGTISNRQAYDSEGNSLFALDNIEFVIQAGSPSIHPNGEMSGAVTIGDLPSTTGSAGSYYAVIAGDVANGDGEIVGIIVHSDGSMQETGGFIVYRNP